MIRNFLNQYKLLVMTMCFVSTFCAQRKAWARDCPSLLQGHLFSIGDSLEIGAEIRAFYFGASVGQDLPTSNLDGSRHFENNGFFALKPLMYWYPRDGLTIVVENEVRFRYPGWESNDSYLIHRPTSVFLEYESDTGTSFSVGLQPVSFGTSALLDQRYVGLGVGYNHRVFRTNFFGGMTMRHLMRNAANSMWMSYTSDTNGWKFTTQNLHENLIGGLILSLKNLRPFRLQFLYLYSQPYYENLRSHAWSIHFSGPIISPYLSFVIEPVFVLMTDDNTFLPGVVAQIRARFGREATSPMLTIGGASSFLHKPDQRMASVYENLSLGSIRRFNLYQGHIAFSRFSWQFFEHAGVFACYYVAFPHAFDDEFPRGGLTDELDAGFRFQVDERYRFDLAYVGINLAGQADPTHAVYVEARIIIGQ